MIIDRISKLVSGAFQTVSNVICRSKCPSVFAEETEVLGVNKKPYCDLCQFVIKLQSPFNDIFCLLGVSISKLIGSFT